MKRHSFWEIQRRFQKVGPTFLGIWVGHFSDIILKLTKINTMNTVSSIRYQCFHGPVSPATSEVLRRNNLTGICIVVKVMTALLGRHVPQYPA